MLQPLDSTGGQGVELLGALKCRFDLRSPLLKFGDARQNVVEPLKERKVVLKSLNALTECGRLARERLEPFRLVRDEARALLRSRPPL